MAKSLANYLEKAIFPLADVPPKLSEQLLSPENMELWRAAFTHESVDRNAAQNYDQFEKLGDAVLKTSYVNFLLHKYPTLTSSELSSLSSYYLSKPILADIAGQLGLARHMEIAISHSLSSSEDLFESLIGAMFWIGNLVGYGKGFIVSDQFVRGVFSQIPVDMSVTKGPPKTQLKEIFEALRWGKPVEEWIQDEKSLPGTFFIRYTPTAMGFLKEQGLVLKSNILSAAKGSTKKVAGEEANRQAIEILSQLGITREWAEAYHRRLEMNSPELSPYIPRVEEKATKEGYVNLYFQNVATTNEERTIQLIGELPDGMKNILVQAGSPSKSTLEIHKDLLKAFLEK